MSQRPLKPLPPELTRYTLLSEWDRAEADELRRRRALEELARATCARHLSLGGRDSL
jgi:hypothetical protein